MKKRSRFAAIGLLMVVTATLLQFMSVTTVASEKKEFYLIRDAAVDFAKTYNGKSIKKNKRMYSVMFRLSNGKYVYSKPVYDYYNNPYSYDKYLRSEFRKEYTKAVAFMHTSARSKDILTKEDKFMLLYNIGVCVSNAYGRLYYAEYKASYWNFGDITFLGLNNNKIELKLIGTDSSGIKHYKNVARKNGVMNRIRHIFGRKCKRCA